MNGMFCLDPTLPSPARSCPSLTSTLAPAVPHRSEDTRFIFKKLLKATQGQIQFSKDGFRHLLPFDYTWQQHLFSKILFLQLQNELFTSLNPRENNRVLIFNTFQKETEVHFCYGKTCVKVAEDTTIHFSPHNTCYFVSCNS